MSTRGKPISRITTLTNEGEAHQREGKSQAHSQTPVHSKTATSRVGGLIHVTQSTEMPILNYNS